MKKFATMAISIGLIGTMVAGGSLAYLQDQDEAVNVMTLGNVQIEQLEYQRAENVAYNAGEAGKGNGIKEGDLVPFKQGQPLYPAVALDNTAYTAEATDLFFWGDYVYSGTAGNGLWNDNKLKNAMDKMVFVKNTGKSDAYVRTLIAFECPEGMEYSEGSDKEFMMNVNGSDLYDWNEIGYITVDNVRYLVKEATYQNALKPGDTAHPSLLQVVMTHNATNEDMKLLGDTYEILVVSQAVQATGFEDKGAAYALNAAFGESANKAAEWFGGTVIPQGTFVATVEELNEALAAEGDVKIALANDINLGDEQITITDGKKVTLHLAGNDITADFATVTDGPSAIFTVSKGASLTINGNGDVHATAAKTTDYVSAIINNVGGDVVINGGDYSMTYGSYAEGYLIPTIVDTNSNTHKATTTINGGTFSHTRNMFRNFAQPQRGDNNATLIINGGTFNGLAEDEAAIWNQKTSSSGVEGDGIVKINGGTFNHVYVENDFETGVTVNAGITIEVK